MKKIIGYRISEILSEVFRSSGDTDNVFQTFCYPVVLHVSRLRCASRSKPVAIATTIGDRIEASRAGCFPPNKIQADWPTIGNDSIGATFSSTVPVARIREVYGDDPSCRVF